MKERLAAAKKGKAPEPTTLPGQAPGHRPQPTRRPSPAMATSDGPRAGR